MADNVAITEGSGTNVAADEISSVKYQRVKMISGADGVNEGDISSSNPMPSRMGPKIIVGGTTTRPDNTTAYAFADCIANSATAASVVPATIAAAWAADVPAVITRCRLLKTSTVTTNACFRLHLYSDSPVCATNHADNQSYSTDKAANYLGSFDITVDRAFTDGAVGIGVPSVGSTVSFLPKSTSANIYYLLEARAAYTPTSEEVYTPILEVL